LYDCDQTGDVSEKKNNTISTAKIERLKEGLGEFEMNTEKPKY
jgi:hypothetical protein